MQETEYSVTEILDRLALVVSRRRWWIVLTAAIATLVTIAIALRLPSHYVSEATLLVVQQQVSQRVVAPPDEPGSNITDALDVIKSEVLSRTRLLAIIEEFGLYPNERSRRAPAEELVDLMRKDVDAEAVDAGPGHGLTTFKISFTAGDPVLAQKVTGRLTSLFIDENSKIRETRAAKTDSFLAEQLNAARARLEEQDRRRHAFQAQYIGELPEQQQSNLVTLSDLRLQLQNTTDRRGQAKQRRATIELALSDKLSKLQSERDALLVRFTPRHPEVIKMDQEIARMKVLVDSLKGNGRIGDKAQNLAPSDDPTAITLINQVQANEREFETLSKEEAQIRGEITRRQNRLEVVPMREQQLAQISRDYELYADQVKDLESKMLQARQSVTIEQRQEGERFRVVDPPALPEQPASPKRLKISLGGMGGGILLGFVLAFLADKKDTSFHTEKAVRQHFNVPLVLGVPMLRTPGEEHARIWKAGLKWVTTGAIALVVGAAEVYIYRHG